MFFLVHWSIAESNVSLKHSISSKRIFLTLVAPYRAYYMIGMHLSSTSAKVTLSLMRLSGIPLGIWLAFKRDMNLHGLWIGLTVSLVYCATIGVWLCLRTDWNYEVEKVRLRLEADKKLPTTEDSEAQN